MLLFVFVRERLTTSKVTPSEFIHCPELFNKVIAQQDAELQSQTNTSEHSCAII